MDMEMPSSLEHWHAATPEAWAAQHPWTEGGPESLRYRPLCRSLLDNTGNAIAKIKPEHHQIFILTLIRMIWTSKELSGGPMSIFGGGLTGQLDAGRQFLQQILDRFLYVQLCSPASSPLSLQETIDMHYQAQNIHLANLYAAGDLMDWLYSVVRDPRSRINEERMRHWATQDPKRVREVAFHSSSVLSILRDHQTNYPFEPFCAFHAGAALWCMAQLLPPSSTKDKSPPLRLDRIPPGASDQMAVRKWISTGVPSRVSVFGVPDLASVAGRQYVLEQTAELLQRMSFWGISQNFVKVVLGLQQINRSTSER